MKKFMILLLAMSLVQTMVLAQEKIVESTITDVTVYLDRAQISREAKVRLEAGNTQVVFSGLSSMLDQNSIQVSGKGSATILGISHRVNHLNELNLPRALRSLRDSIQWLSRQLIIEQGNKENLVKEEQLLMSNQKIGGTATNLSATELKAMADFYRARMGEIIVTRQRLEERIKSLHERNSRLSNQYNELNEIYSRSTSEIVVTLTASVATLAELEIRYVVPQAGWYPVYDIRAIDTKSPVNLMYKANVFQSTGEEWRNVKLTLSTANPSLGGLKPELNPWFIDVRQIRAKYKLEGAVHRGVMAAPAEEVRAEKSLATSDVMEIESASKYMSTVQTALNTTFILKIPYTVASSNKPVLVDIATYPLKAEYRYAATPKLDGDAFLQARITGWEELSLVEGEANIFFEGTFVTKSGINPEEFGDTLNLSLGRDKRIVLKREKLKDFTSRKTIGSNQKETFAYEISIRNTKTEAVDILVEDHIPVSTTSQIEVTLTDAGGAKWTTQNGKIEWNLKLQPNETRKLVYKFEVKYPKGVTVSGL